MSHAIWTLSFAVVVAALLFALAFRNYTLSWETTILEPGFFVQAVRWLGTVPGWLGFPVPDAQAVLAPTAGSASQRAWALWLTGCIVAYGLLPRVVFAIVCAGVWQARKAALQPDLAQPAFAGCWHASMRWHRGASSTLTRAPCRMAVPHDGPPATPPIRWWPSASSCPTSWPGRRAR